MKKGLVWVAAGVMLAGCGGGGDDTPAPPPVASQPAPVPVTPPPPPPPTVSVLTAGITRQVAVNTGIAMEVVVKPSFTPAGTLYASAAGMTGTDLVPADAVTVTPNSDGSFTLGMSTRAGTDAGSYKGEFTVKLCSDAACATPQAVPSIKIPYAITVVEAGKAWPGDKITPLAPWEGVADWSTFQGNAAHTGFVPVTLNPDQFSLRWKIGSVSLNNNYGVAQPATLAAANGLFYVAKGKKLEARKELDGSLAWSYDVGTLAYPSVNPPAVAGGVVYMAAGQQSSTYMFALDAATGGMVFKTPMASQWENYLAPVAYDGAVYTNAGMYGGLYALKSTGELMFTAPAQQGAMWSPAVDANSAYVFVNGALTVYDRKTGTQRSKILDTSASAYGAYGYAGAPVLASAGTVIAADYSSPGYMSPTNSLLKINVEKGYVDWRQAGVYTVTPAFANGVIYAPNKSPYRLEARAESDGALRWSWTPPIAGEINWLAEPVVTNNMVFVSTDKNTYAIDMRTGKAVWSYPLAGRLALTRSGILYIHSVEALVAVNVK